MSSPARTLGHVPTASTVVNAKKRVLTDSEDTEERESKRVRPQDVIGDQEKRRDAKEKKRRRKKKRKLSVVQAAESPDAEIPVFVLKSATIRARSCSVGPGETSTTIITNLTHPNVRQPSAGPSAVPVYCSPTPRNEDPSTLNPTSETCADKGKGRATSVVVMATQGEDQVTELKEQMSVKTNTITRHENLVSALQQSLSCQICLDLMHKPFALSPCGHSACYPCLINWFKAPPPDVPADDLPPTWLRKKTCPHCRSIIKERPIEIWAIKEMVATLVKSGLGQSSYNPSPGPADGVANADPWAGIFRSDRGNQDVFPDDPYPAPLQQLMGLRDDEDGGVYRCIDCHHEIWGGTCSQCGRVYPGHDHHDDNDSDDYDDDSVHDMWRDEAEHAWADEEAYEGLAFMQYLAGAFVNNHRHPRLAFGFRDDESLDHDWDGGGDTEIDSDSEDMPGYWGLPVPRANQPVGEAHIEEIDEEGDGGEEDGYESSFIDDGDASSPARRDAHSHQRASRVSQEPIELSDDDDDEDEDNEGVHFVGFGRRPSVRGRGRGPIVVDSDEDGSRDLDHDDDDDRSLVEDDDQDYEYSYRRDLELEDDGSEGGGGDDDLAAQVAARELDIYGDDGSVPRRGRYDDPDGSDEDYY